MRIIDQLVVLADHWCAHSERSRARLSTIVINDGKFFEKVEHRGAGCTVATFEKFLSFFRNGENWPDNRIPQDAVDLLDNFSNIATDAAASAGNEGEDSPCSENEQTENQMDSLPVGSRQETAGAANVCAVAPAELGKGKAA